MARGNESCSTARAPTLGAVSPGLSGADQFPVRLGEPAVTDILTNDEISLLRSLEKKSRTITGNFTHKRYDRLETEGYIKRSSQSPFFSVRRCWRRSDRTWRNARMQQREAKGGSRISLYIDRPLTESCTGDGVGG